MGTLIRQRVFITSFDTLGWELKREYSIWKIGLKYAKNNFNYIAGLLPLYSNRKSPLSIFLFEKIPYPILKINTLK